MSHFTVMVVTDNLDGGTLEKALQPFHEYECTGKEDEYVVFVEAEETEAELKIAHKEDAEKYPEHHKEDFGQFLDEDYGYHKKDGKWGKMTNPNAQWDWWVLGGRWSNHLLLKDGNTADQAKMSDIDFAEKKGQQEAHFGERYDRAYGLIRGREFKTWVQCRDDFEKIDDARTFYHAQDPVKDLKEMSNSFFFNADDFYTMTREQYVYKNAVTEIGCFAVLMDGKWNQRGDMGWFGCVGDEKTDWEKQFEAMLEKMPADKFISIVDCHI